MAICDDDDGAAINCFLPMKEKEENFQQVFG
jgi:hypothetical protein